MLQSFAYDFHYEKSDERSTSAVSPVGTTLTVNGVSFTFGKDPERAPKHPNETVSEAAAFVQLITDQVKEQTGIELALVAKQQTTGFGWGPVHPLLRQPPIPPQPPKPPTVDGLTFEQTLTRKWQVFHIWLKDFGFQHLTKSHAGEMYEIFRSATTEEFNRKLAAKQNPPAP